METVGRETPNNQRCKAAAANGAQCKAPRMPSSNFCRAHRGSTYRNQVAKLEKESAAATLESLPIETPEDLAAAIAATVNDVRSGALSAQQGATLSSLYGRLQDLFVEKRKLDPKTIAMKKFTAQTARNLANQLDLKTKREIAENRNPDLVVQIIEKFFAGDAERMQKNEAAARLKAVEDKRMELKEALEEKRKEEKASTEKSEEKIWDLDSEFDYAD